MALTNYPLPTGWDVARDSTTGNIVQKVVLSDPATGNLVAPGGGGGGGGTSSNFGSVFPAAGTAIGVKSGANMVNLLADGSGNLLINLQTALPAGANTIGGVNIASALPAGANNIGLVNLGAALPAGANNIGLVNLGAALPAGANTIGSVTALASGAISNPLSVLTRPASAVSANVTYTLASPTVFTWSGNPLVNGQSVQLSAGTGVVPSGATAGTPYFVVGVSGNTFGLSTTFGGSANINANASNNCTATLVYISGANASLIASAAAVGSVVVPSFAIGGSAGGVIMPRIRLWTNAASGWLNANLAIRFWSAAPTYANGDGGPWVANGVANLMAKFVISLSDQINDGTIGWASPAGGNSSTFKLPSGTSVFWDIQCLSQVNPNASQTFNLIPEFTN